MRVEIRDRNKKVRGVWVARTRRGFNQKQQKEIEKLHQQLDREHAAGSTAYTPGGAKQ